MTGKHLRCIIWEVLVLWSVDLYDYTTNKVETYKLNDPKLEEFQKRADLMSDKIKNIFNEETLDGVDLFNKTINDIKETKVSK